MCQKRHLDAPIRPGGGEGLHAQRQQELIGKDQQQAVVQCGCRQRCLKSRDGRLKDSATNSWSRRICWRAPGLVYLPFFFGKREYAAFCSLAAHALCHFPTWHTRSCGDDP